jgi:hypothetical protein
MFPVPDEELRRSLENFSIAGVAALQFITSPQVWPGFVAWAEQQAPDETWTESDREDMARLIRFGVLMTGRDTLGEQPGPGPGPG